MTASRDALAGSRAVRIPFTRAMRLLESAGMVLLALIAVSALAVYMTPRFGWRVDGLRSGSMYPEMKAGDLVITRPVDARSVSVGDIIVFRAPGNPRDMVSHRVIGIESESSLAFKTKGDANASPDPFLVPAGNVVGEVYFTVSFLGYLALFLKTETGLVSALLVPGVVVLLLCLNEMKRELRKDRIKR